MHGILGSSRRGWFGVGPNEAKLTVAGFVVGMVLGLLIGGIGIAARGTAFGLPACIVLGIALAMVGNRVGVGLDRPRA
jgi:hypothetical protein